MSKGLEALKELSDELYYCNDKEMSKTHIESRLIVEKELKALEIIKKKANIVLLDELNDEHYWLDIACNTKLTQEEYDLLEEVLL